MNVVAEPTSSGGSVTPKFKQSTIDTSSYLGYMTYTPTANRFFILDYTNSNASGTVEFSRVLLNSNCDVNTGGGVTSYFSVYTAGSNLPSPYTSNSLSASDTKKIIYQPKQSVSASYTIQITARNASTPTGITITRASFGN